MELFVVFQRNCGRRMISYVKETKLHKQFYHHLSCIQQSFLTYMVRQIIRNLNQFKFPMSCSIIILGNYRTDSLLWLSKVLKLINVTERFQILHISHRYCYQHLYLFDEQTKIDNSDTLSLVNIDSDAPGTPESEIRLIK